MSYNGLTNQGLEYLTRCQVESKPVVFSKVKIGNGNIPMGSTGETTTDLYSFKKEIEILNKEQVENSIKMEILINNFDVLEEFYVKEIGVYVMDNDVEKLYWYINKDRPSPLPDKNTPAKHRYILHLETSQIESIILNYTGIDLLVDKDFVEKKIKEKVRTFEIPTIAELQSRKNLKVDDIVEVLGYYSAGDGAGHKRIIVNEDDGSGVQLANGLWANLIIPNSLKGIIGKYSGMFPLSSAIKDGVYLYPQSDKFYICISEYNGDILDKPNETHFEELNVFKNKVDIPARINEYNRYIVPEFFGAYGDGIHDDTDALKKSFLACKNKYKTLKLKGKYKITDSIYDGKNVDEKVRIHIEGNYNREGNWDVDDNGIILSTENSFIKNCPSLTGSLSKLNIRHTTNNNLAGLFEMCNLSRFDLINNNIISLGYIMKQSWASGRTLIKDNRIMGLKSFSLLREGYNFIDSTIEGNYFQGRASDTDSYCFDFSNYNGSLITHNFIDFFNTIYLFKVSGEDLPVSIANHYQAFRYLYSLDYSNPDEAQGNSGIYSTSDIFNWNDPITLEWLQKQKIRYYKDISDNSLKEVPPCIVWYRPGTKCRILNASIQGNIKNLGFIEYGIMCSQGSYCDVKFNVVSFKKFTMGYAKKYYNTLKEKKSFFGNFCNSGCIREFETLPPITYSDSPCYCDEVIKCGNKYYKMVHDPESKEVGVYARWQEIYHISGLVPIIAI